MRNLSLVKVGGVCAILVAVAAFSSSIMDPFSASYDGIDEWLQSVSDDRGGFLTALFIAVSAPLLALAAGLGFYQSLRETGAIMWIALAAWLSGMLMLILGDVADIGMAFELAPRHAQADEATKAVLEVMAATVSVTGHLMDHVGILISIGIGMALFSFGSIRLSYGPK